MAGTSGSQQFNPHSLLDEKQQNLLLAALSSNSTGNTLQQTSFPMSNPDLTSLAEQSFSGAIDPSYFSSPQQNVTLSTFDTFNVEETPYIDFAEADPNFDFGEFEGDDSMIGPLPGDEPDVHDKRKSPEEGDESEENGAKRQEGEDKAPKKPGRKPLTSEPTTKRKAQNRAAQRAFRERKEKHLKDLETKVNDLEKQSEAEKHENGLLRAQVERLQTELREYRKRLSRNSVPLGGSPPIGGYPSYLANLANQQNSSNSFSFEFPRFGGLPGAHIFNNGQMAKQNGTTSNGATPQSTQSNSPGLNRNDSLGRSVSPKTAAQTPSRQGSTGLSTVESFTTLFGNTNGNAATDNTRARSSTDTSTNPSRIFQFNSGSTSSNSGSPSASSNSQYGNNVNSSCGTSPEASHSSPGNLDTLNAEKGYVCHGNSEGEILFCEKLNMACGNPRNPMPRAKSSTSDGVPPAQTTQSAAAATTTVEKMPAAPLTTTTSNNDNLNGIETMANQNGGQFDPSLFGDYRDSTAAIVGDGDFSGGFFDAAFSMPDFGSPFNGIQTPAILKRNPLEEIEKLQDGVNDEEEVVPADDMSTMLNCHKIWDTLQTNPEFKEGSFDIDGLCSELRAKARCSESGVVVDQKDVDAALKRMPKASPQAQ